MIDQNVLRLTAFLCLLCLVAGAENLYPKRRRSLPRRQRWPANLGVLLVGQLAARLLAPIAPVALAALLRERGMGLGAFLALPAWVEFGAALLALDLGIYGQHVAMHRVRTLWLFHRMHHADVDLDASTALRFHPVEILLSLWYKLALILALAPSPASVLAFEILLNGCAMFNHANLALPQRLDRWLRLLVVTPDMHRVHHSTDMREANTNYGFNFPWWDRLFTTYTPQPAKGHESMSIGLNIFRDAKYSSLLWLLRLPFVKGR